MTDRTFPDRPRTASSSGDGTVVVATCACPTAAWHIPS
jgi:hypothetical protein